MGISFSAEDLISADRFDINKAAYSSWRIAWGFFPEKFSNRTLVLSSPYLVSIDHLLW